MKTIIKLSEIDEFVEKINPNQLMKDYILQNPDEFNIQIIDDTK